MKYQKPVYTLAVFIALSAVSSAWASVDTSAKPDGVYRLKPGIYIAEGASCEAPANVDIRHYTGKGISTAHTRACKVTVKSRKRQTFQVVQSCIDAGAGPGARFLQRQQVKVHDALTFTQTIRSRSTTFRYCPISYLPDDLRKASGIK